MYIQPESVNMRHLPYLGLKPEGSVCGSDFGSEVSVSNGTQINEYYDALKNSGLLLVSGFTAN